MLQHKSILQLAREAFEKGLTPEQVAPVLGVSVGTMEKFFEIEKRRKIEEQKQLFFVVNNKQP